MTKKELYKKFNNDIAKRSRFMRFLLVLDQMFNVLLKNGSQDETISSYTGRKIQNGTATWFDKKLCSFLNRFEKDHCNKSLGE
jgi:hypothetical protein